MRRMLASTRRMATTGAFGVLAIACTNVARAQIADTSFVLVRPVTFQMGAPEYRPIHPVEISHGFLLQKTEVMQAQWTAVMRSNPSVHKDCGPTCPVENVNWEDVQSFIAELNLRSPGKTYRLPTEAEWELAARSMPGGVGPVQAWTSETSGGKPHPVATLHPYAKGLYDMSGNVWEWVSDWYAPYGTFSDKDPKGPATGDKKVLRGGAFDYVIALALPGSRRSEDPTHREGDIGFRLVREP
jgi:formylglycine-generating enzyme required for sulfatase activity